MLGRVITAVVFALAVGATASAQDHLKPGKTFVPPPRTIADLKALIGELQEVPDADTCAAKQAWRAKNLTLTIDRIRRAKSKSARDGAASSLVVASESEFVRGNFRATTKMIKRAINSLPERRHTVRKAVFHAQLASVYGSIGDRRQARRHTGRARAFWKGIKRGAREYYNSQDGTDKRILYMAIADAAVAQAGGQLDIAEAKFRTAIEMARTTGGFRGTYVDVIRLRTELAANLLQQGRLAEAEQATREALAPSLKFHALAKFHDALARFHDVYKFSSRIAMPLTQLAETFNERGRLTDAEYLARVAIHMHRLNCSLPDSLSFARTRQVLASILASKEDWSGVIEEIEAARQALKDDPETFERLFGDNINWAMALIHERRSEEGIGLMERALVRTTAKEGEESYETAEVRGLLAMARTFSGDIRGAVEDYKRALPRLIVGRDQLAATTGQNVHNARARRIIEAYMSLLVQISSDELESELGLDIAEQLFQVANVAQNSSVQRALAAAAVRSTPDDPLLAETLRREQDAAQEMNWALNTLATLEFAPPSQVDGDIIKTLRGRVLELRAARQTLVSEIRAKFPEFSRLMTPKPTSLAEVQAHLRPGEAMIATYVGKRRSFVWAVPAAGRPAFHAAPISRADLRDMVGLLRGALDPRPQTLADIPAYDLETAHLLYKELLAPIEATWRPAKSLIVVAHGPLGLLPFALLPTEPAKLPRKGALLFDGYRSVPWLARSHAVTVLPSVASLVTLRATRRSSAPRRAFVGFGDPWFSSDQAALVQDSGDQPVMLAAAGGEALRGLPIRLRNLPVMDDVDSAELARLPRLPDTADELRSIALALNADPTQDVFIGAEASETRVKTMDLSDRKVIAFATHGLVAGDLNGLTQPALAFSSPAVVGGEDDGLLTMGEVLGLKLDADWVVLSACNTGSAAGAGAEAISGLGRAFFYAGARALLVSNWPVHSDAAKSLITDIFQRQAADPALTRAEALRGAMLGMIDQGGFKDASGQMLFSYAHPLFWAPFSIIGDGG